jgi:DNA-binding MarR family transcriptional regulator
MIDLPTVILKTLKTDESKLSGEESRVLLAVVALIERKNPADHRIELTQTEIGNTVRMTQPSVSATIASLVEGKFLTKEDAPRGRHKVYGLGEKLLKHARSEEDDE